MSKNEEETYVILVPKNFGEFWPPGNKFQGK